MPKVRIFSVAHEPNFIEPMRGIALSCSELGHDAKVVGWKNKGTDFGDINIVITAHRPFDPVNSLPRSSTNILFQVEELWNRREKGVYDKAHGWDYVLELFEENCKISMGTERVRYFPLGWSSAFGTELYHDKSLNGYFFGSMTPRRQAAQSQLNDKFARIRFTQGEWGTDRDDNIVRAKINVSIKANDVWDFAPIRALLVLCKGGFLLCEESDSGYGPYKPGGHFVTFKNQRELIIKFRYYLARPKVRQDFAHAACEHLKRNCVLTTNLATAMQGIL